MQASQTRVLYDGGCGLCRGTVRFLQRADRRNELVFAPQPGTGGTVLVETPDGRVLTRSEAVLFALSRLGQPWPVFAALGRLIPRRMADAAYDAIARNRHNLVCPRE